jgi:hypothetical protein
MVQVTDDWSWEDVERLLSDLKSDGYEPANLETSTSHAAPEKTLFLDVERSERTDTKHNESE